MGAMHNIKCLTNANFSVADQNANDDSWFTY